MKAWYASKTIWAGLATTLLAVAMFADEQLKAGVLPVSPEAKVWILFGIGVLVLILRMSTSQPISPLRGPPEPPPVIPPEHWPPPGRER